MEGEWIAFLKNSPIAVFHNAKPCHWCMHQRKFIYLPPFTYTTRVNFILYLIFSGSYLFIPLHLISVTRGRNVETICITYLTEEQLNISDITFMLLYKQGTHFPAYEIFHPFAQLS